MDEWAGLDDHVKTQGIDRLHPGDDISAIFGLAGEVVDSLVVSNEHVVTPRDVKVDAVGAGVFQFGQPILPVVATIAVVVVLGADEKERLSVSVVSPTSVLQVVHVLNDPV